MIDLLPNYGDHVDQKQAVILQQVPCVYVVFAQQFCGRTRRVKFTRPIERFAGRVSKLAACGLVTG
jgi:hypothetical protein